MNKKIVYTKVPKDISGDIFEGEIIDDFLPPPEQLVRKDEKVKITITLNTQSVDFFKGYAAKHKMKYQTMINEVLNEYVQKNKNKINV
jgi:predicted DNA binding CopG/RHH family protein